MVNLEMVGMLSISDNEASEQVGKRFEELRDDILGIKNKNTTKAYLNDFSLFQRFCKSNDLVSLSSNIEITKRTLKEYVLYLAKGGIKKKSIKRKLAAISYFLDIGELANPIKSSRLFNEFLNAVMHNRDFNDEPRQANAFTLYDLNNYNKLLIESESLSDIRNLAIMNLAFDTLLRASNIIDLKYSDIFKNNENSVMVRWSKTDQLGQGRKSFLSDTTSMLCRKWIERANVSNGYLFRRISKSGKVFEGGLSYNGLLWIMKDAGLVVGRAISCHSTRVGSAVSMFEAGISEIEIMRHGHWNSTAMVARYTESAKLKVDGMGKLRNSLTVPDNA